jgi:hypothetical protein
MGGTDLGYAGYTWQYTLMKQVAYYLYKKDE